MGGYGSGWQGSKRATVEDGLTLSEARLTRTGLLGPNRHQVGTVTWTNTATGEQAATIGLDPDVWAEQGSTRLHYTRDKTDAVDYRVAVTSTPLPWGGRRWWFACPLVVDGRACGRRCDKLYLPPGRRHFGCRRCHGQTYTSCQESHKHDRWAALLGQDLGLSARGVLRMLNE
ncbi:MAG: hypothetical protein JWO31_3481 [Phycisphaerales bacterium]|nr:hypothetical protein [Phycisphaerales bacterium]